MSKFLAVDSSSRYLTVVAVNGDKRAVRYVENCALKHSVVLMGEVDAALDGAGLTAGECDFFAAVTGPGSFTGIRIGIACVKGLALAAGKPCAGVTTFELLSYNVNSEEFLVAVDALHGNYYVCGYRGGEQDVAPCFINAEQVKSFNRAIYGFEDLPFENYRKVRPEQNLAGAAEKYAKRAGEVAALYVKKSQAEEERATRLAQNNDR